MPRESRRQKRKPLKFKVHLTWKQGETDVFALGKCVDVSEAGLRVETKVEIPAGTFVTFRTLELGFGGTGLVRNVGRKTMVYEIGVEFCGGLRWTPQCQTT